METMMTICTITMLFNIALMLGLVKEMGELHKEVGKLDIQMFCINRKYDRAKADGSDNE